MKRLLTLCIGLFYLPALADQYNLLADDTTAKVFKTYVIQDNNLNKCLYPEIYRSQDRGEDVLEKWWNDEEGNGRLKRSHYLKLKMRLAQKVMGNELSEVFLFGTLSTELEAQYQTALKQYAKTTTVKTKKDCERISKFAFDLVENYDEINGKWQE